MLIDTSKTPLLYEATWEIHDNIEALTKRRVKRLTKHPAQVIILDMIYEINLIPMYEFIFTKENLCL